MPSATMPRCLLLLLLINLRICPSHDYVPAHACGQQTNIRVSRPRDTETRHISDFHKAPLARPREQPVTPPPRSRHLLSRHALLASPGGAGATRWRNGVALQSGGCPKHTHRNIARGGATDKTHRTRQEYHLYDVGLSLLRITVRRCTVHRI